jgi:hypothetical protein
MLRSPFAPFSAALIALGVASSASAVAYVTTANGNLVTNGDFSTTTATTSRQMSDDSNVNNGKQYVTGWTNSYASGGTAGYNFIVKGAQGTATDGIDTNDNPNMSLWGLADGKGGYTKSFALSDAAKGSGGNYLAADGAYEQSLIYQVITGLTVGQKYTLTFNWAGAQQSGYDGATTDNWTVYWGTSTSDYVSQQTATITDASHGFTGWQSQTMTLTATSATEILGFLATGTPNGQPPIALLDDVSLVKATAVVAAVPEPAAWTMMIVGFGAVGTSLRRRRKLVLDID